MAQAHVDPEQLEQFAAELVALVHDLEDVRQRLQAGLRRLGYTWRDQEYERFVASFVAVTRLIGRFSSEIEKVHPKLKQDAEYIREYLKTPGA